MRLTDLPNDETAVDSRATGPIDRPSYVLAIACFAGGLLLLLGLALAASSTVFSWEFALFLFPAVLFASAAVAAYRANRQPYER